MTTTTDHYLGIDVHKTDAYVAVMDDEGTLVEEVRVASGLRNVCTSEYVAECRKSRNRQLVGQRTVKGGADHSSSAGVDDSLH